MIVLEDEFLAAIPVARNWAGSFCKTGYPDPDGCSWYHGAWPLLRLAGVVSNPFWHESFFRKSFEKFKLKNVQVVGAADFSMPYLCHLGGCEKIYMIDICETPVRLCHWFSDRHNLGWSTRRSDIRNVRTHPAIQIDAIVNDAFLTRFQEHEKQNVVDSIYNALPQGGKYITTVRRGAVSKKGYRSPKKERDLFVAKTLKALDGKHGFAHDWVVDVAKGYIEKMLSYPIANIRQMTDLLENSGFHMEYVQEAGVAGESERSTYFRVVATK